jgi:hypothetical protein
MTELACEIIFAGTNNYDSLPSDLRRRIADKIPPQIIERGIAAIMNFLGVGKKFDPHCVLIC